MWSATLTHMAKAEKSVSEAPAGGRWRWSPGWRMSLAVAVTVPLCLLLANWQFDRAAQKRSLEAQYFERIGALAQRPPAVLGEIPAFSRLRLDGAYEAGRHFLVDNRTYDGRAGYWVVSVFRDRGGRRWLINRGWIAGDGDRDRLPGSQALDVSGPVRLEAVAWPDTGLPPLLSRDDWAAAWPKRVQRLNVERMAATAGTEALQLRLEAGAPGSLQPASQGLEFAPERHTGYGWQWLGIASAVLLGYGCFGFWRHGKKGE